MNKMDCNFSDERPFLSVVVATYNSQKFIAECLNSIVSQNYQNFEIIILDGNSTDDTINIAKSYLRPVDKWISEPDSGIYDAWNKAIRISIGEWICFVGSDDVLLPGCFSYYVDYIQKNAGNEVDFISARIDIVDDKLNFISTVGDAWTWQTFRKSMITWHLSSMHSKTLFEKYGMFNTEYTVSGDYEFLLRIGENLKAGFVNERTALMRNTGISSSKIFKANYQTYKAKIVNKAIDPATGTILFLIDFFRLCFRKL